MFFGSMPTWAICSTTTLSPWHSVCWLQNCFLGAECILGQGQPQSSVVSVVASEVRVQGCFGNCCWVHGQCCPTIKPGVLEQVADFWLFVSVILEGSLATGWVLNRFASCLCYIQVSILPRAGLFRGQKCIFFNKKKSSEKKPNDTGPLVCKELFYLFALWEKKIKTLEMCVGSLKEWHNWDCSPGSDTVSVKNRCPLASMGIAFSGSCRN